jgi:hypothetical protein
MPTVFPSIPTPTEIAFVMMVIGYVITIATAYRLLFFALAWALTQLVAQTTALLAQYAPRTLVRVQALAMWPIWVVWLAMDKTAAVLQSKKDEIARSYLKQYEKLESAAKAVDIKLVS